MNKHSDTLVMSDQLSSVIFLFFFLSLASSCELVRENHDHIQAGESTRTYSATAGAFTNYVKRFESYGQTLLNNPYFVIGDIPINFGKTDTLSANTRGLCKLYPDGTKEILLDETWWKTTTEEKREAMLFHELGHCRLGRTDHVNNYLNTGTMTIKQSLLNSEIPSTEEYRNYKNHYLSELFLMSSPYMSK